MNSFGNNLRITIFGESHKEAMGICLDGIPCGVKINRDYIDNELNKRRPSCNDTKRVEKDNYKIISGVLNDVTTGSPISIIIANNDVDSSQYEKNKYIFRPSHSDYPYYVKFNGFNDYRGGGASSGRLTVLLVIAGAICKNILEQKGIYIKSHIKKIDCIEDSSFSNINSFNEENYFIDFDNDVYDNIVNKTKDMHDSIGGIIETGISGLIIGVGEPYFNSLESVISHMLFSIGSIKGVEFGDGFDFANKVGSNSIDEMEYIDGVVNYKANHNGGILGGVSNGNDVLIKSVVKPIASINKEVCTIDYNSKENITYINNGRNDTCILRRIMPVINNAIAICLFDLLISYKGKDYFK